MRRALRLAGILLAVLVALLALNFFVLEGQTREAEVTVEGGKLIDANGVGLQYVDRPATGSGPEGSPIVLLHCFTCSLSWWNELTPLINEGHRVIAFDLIGHGGSEKPKGGYEIETQSAALASALNDLGVRGATVVGHSMGGLVATSLAEQASDLVDRIVLIGSANESGDAELPLTARASTVPVLGGAIWRLKLDSMVRSASADAFAPGADVSSLFDDPDQVVNDVEAMTYRSYEQSDAAIDDFLGAGSVVSRLTRTGVPVLAMDGTEDQIIDSDRVLGELAAIPGARIVPIEDAGHSPNVEQPQRVADQILRFAAEAPPPRRAKPSGAAAGSPKGKPGSGRGARP